VKIVFPITAIPRDYGDYGDPFLCPQRFSPCLRASVGENCLPSVPLRFKGFSFLFLIRVHPRKSAVGFFLFQIREISGETLGFSFRCRRCRAMAAMAAITTIPFRSASSVKISGKFFSARGEADFCT
jgi:hypothetical protein